MAANPKPVKLRKCKVCREWFPPWNTLQPTCGIRCAMAFDKVQKAKKARLEKRDGRLRLMSRRDWTLLAQRAFNAFIRERDKFEPCISCHMPETYGGQWHACHYRSTAAAPELRFDEQNVHKGCAQCNTHKSGNVVEYRLRLIAKIGQVAVDRLEGPHEPAKWTAEDLKAICMSYRAKLKHLKFKRESAASFA